MLKKGKEHTVNRLSDGFLFIETKWFALLFAVTAVIFTFPIVLNYLGEGVDYAYIWAYNVLFADSMTDLSRLIFTYGPLGFLKFPLAVGYNWEIGFVFAFLIRFLQAIYFLLAWKKFRGRLGIGAYVALLVLLKLTQFDLVFASIMLCTGLIAKYERTWVTWVPAILLSVVALYIKFSIGMLAFSIFGGLLFSEIITRSTSFARISFLVVLSLLTAWLVGFALTGAFDYFFIYANNALNLSSAYSASLSLHPETDRLYLFLAIGLLIVAYFILEWKAWRPELFLPIFFGLFVVWKHSIVREESWHIFLLVQYLMFACLFFIIRSRRNSIFFILASLFGMFFIWRYTHSLGGIKNYLIGSNAPGYFFEQLKLLDNKPGTLNDKGVLDAYRLPADIKNEVGSSTVDVYPWNLLYFAANDLHEQLRPGLQSIDFNPWLDKQNADFYAGEESPEYILWHRNTDRFGNELGSFEERYQLSAEPLTVDAILSYYEPRIQNSDLLLLKRKGSTSIQYNFGERNQFRLNENIPVPQAPGLIKVRLFLSLNGYGKVLSAIYKEPAFFVRYTFSDGRQSVYNILRHNAVSGIWVQPFLSSLYYPDSRMLKPDSIGIFVSEPSLAHHEFDVQWQFAELPTTLEALQKKDSVVFYEHKYSDAVSSVVPYGFTDLLIIPIDSLPSRKVELCVSALCRQPLKTKSRLIISIDSETGNKFWTGSYMDSYLPVLNRWGSVYITRTLDLSQYKGCLMKIYFMNEGFTLFEIKNVQISMRVLGEF